MKTIIAVLTLAALTGCAVPAETAQPPAAGQSQPAEQPARQATGAPTPKHWVTVTTLKGSGNKRGTTFHLSGGDAKLSYTVKDTSGIGAVSVGVYVMAKGTSLEKSGGFAEVMADKAGKDSTQLAKDAGDYYLDVQAANASWTVTVQEKRP